MQSFIRRTFYNDAHILLFFWVSFTAGILLSGDRKCQDSALVDCVTLDRESKICSLGNSATDLYCPRYCHRCHSATTTTTTTTAATTLIPPSECRDSPLIDCSLLNSSASVCTVVTSATRLYCPIYCGLCVPETTSTQTTTTTTTTMTTTVTTTTTATTTTPSITTSIILSNGTTVTTIISSPTTTTTTSTTTVSFKLPDPCVDSSRVDCSVLDRNMSICNPVTMATNLYCPAYCGLCITTTLIPPTTTSACVDNHFVDCAGLNASLHICADPNNPTANSFCVQYCGLC